MKKILVALICTIFLLIGCENMKNTPTAKVENFLSKYQKMDHEVLKELDTVLKQNTTMTKEQKDKYKSLLKKQYQNLSYKIKNEETRDNTATVEVEIEVLDYKNAIENSKDYYINHKEDFIKDDNDSTDGLIEDTIETLKRYIDYKIEQMKLVNNKINYGITFTLTKEDDMWKINPLTEEDIQKIHGIY